MPRFKRKLLGHIAHTHSFLRVLIGALLIFLVIFLLGKVFVFFVEHNVSPGMVKSLVLNEPPPIPTTDGRVNIVLLGMPGGMHEGHNLTDTIQLVSVDTLNKDVVFVTIPRDVWLPSLKQRINAAYREGENKRQGGGMIVAKAAVEEVLGVNIHYGVVVNFAGFTRLIDLVGGIEVDVENAFDDYKYPVAGKENDVCGGDPEFSCRYEHLHIDEGRQHMNGEKALKYVRSRQAIGSEGSDFARGRRQQQVLVALKDKLQSSTFWSDADNLKQLMSIVDDTVESDMTWSERLLLVRYAVNLQHGNIRRILIDNGDEQKKETGFLTNPPLYQYGGAWVLVPRTGNFDEIHQYVSCHLEDPQCSMKP